MPDLSEKEMQELARTSFGVFMAYVHETDSPFIDSGQALVPPHMEEVILRYELVASILLREEGWEAWSLLEQCHTSLEHRLVRLRRH